MAMLKQMKVQGIRSFDPSSDSAGQRIEFYSPMTLIVGQNGCGKTTIIEALKFAITGEQPPNTKGGSFVSDPKLSSGYEVKACVMLELQDKKDGKIVVARKLKAESKGKKGNVSVSTLENTISRDQKTATGTKKLPILSGKCADVKEEMCRIMGVSEAILNHVIFCHQEDSCWPLEEASKVKTKFDAIFNTTKYIKAVKSLTDKEKDMGHDLKVEKVKLGHSSENLKKVVAKKGELERVTTELHALTDKNSEHLLELKEIEKKLRSLEALREQYQTKHEIVARKQARITSIEESIAETRSQVKEVFEGDSGSLDDTISKFERCYEQKKKLLDKLNNEKKRKSDEQRVLSSKNTKLVEEGGKFREREEMHSKNTSEMSSLLTTLSTHLQPLLGDPSSDSEFRTALSSLSSAVEREFSTKSVGVGLKALGAAIGVREKELGRIKKSYESKEGGMRNRIEELNKEKTEMLTEVSMMRETESKSLRKLSSLKAELATLDGSSEELAHLSREEERYTSLINSIESSGVIKGAEEAIGKLKEEIRELEEKRSVAAAQGSLLSKDLPYKEKIRILEGERGKLVDSSKELIRKFEPSLKSLMSEGVEVSESEYKNFLVKKLKTLGDSIKLKQAEVKKSERVVTESQTKINSMEKEIKSKKDELQKHKREVEKLIGDKKLEDEIEIASEELEEVQKDIVYSEAVQFLLKKYLKKVKKDSCCPLCTQGLSQKDTLIKSLNEQISGADRSSKESDLIRLKSRHESLVQLKPSWATISKLEKDIPAFEESLKKVSKNLETQQSGLDELTDALYVLECDKASGESVQAEVVLYDANRNEISNIEKKVKELEGRRDPRAKALTLTLEDVQTELESFDASLRGRLNEKESREGIRTKKSNELMSAREKRASIIEKKNSITTALQNREGMEEQKREIEKEIAKLKNSVQEVSRKIPGAESKINEAKAELNLLIKKREEELQVVVGHKTELERQRVSIEKLNRDIIGFEELSGEYERFKKRHEEVKRDLKACEEKIKELTNEIELLSTEVSSQEMKQRELNDNRLIKKKEEELERLRAEILEDQRAIDLSKITGVTAQISSLSSKHSALSATKNKSDGTIDRIKQNIEGLRRELREDGMANAETVHRDNLIKKTVIELAHKDVRLYRMALDSAIMMFHSMKMETINKYLKVYWKRIYRGSDIDHIEIKTDNNEETAAGNTVKIDMSKTQRRSYNYRVVMIRRGIELDMRGRCSAGQKVLASIIIRLALAQTFSTQCGVISLDEPTTNLDKENIESLATMLSDLAMSMRNDKTFQMIVITHDKEFIDRLLMVDKSEYYFRVSRNQSDPDRDHLPESNFLVI